MTKKKTNGAEPSLKIEQWPIDKVLPYARNARLHSDAQVAAIAASITEFGFINPCLVDANDVLIAGHGRVLASKLLKRTTVPVIQLGHLTEMQARALRLADNQLPMQATWSTELLQFEIGQLKIDGYDIPMLGFSEAQLRGFGVAMGTDGAADPEAAPEPPKKPTSRVGDVWVLGEHRLACGDSTDKSVVTLVLDGAKPHLMVTDPPYGVDFDPTWRKGSERRTYMVDRPDDETIWKAVWELFDGDVVYIWHGSWDMPRLYLTLEGLGFEVRAQIIWNKDRFIIGRGHYCFNHEPCFYAARKGKTAHWQGARDQPTVWTIQHKASDTNHGAQKPIECMKRPIENNSKAGDSVYEPFSGSGTTIIAGEMTGRRVLAIELDPGYVDVAVLRWQTFTGKLAVLEGSGKTFAEVALDRQRGRPVGQKKTPAARAGASAKAAVGA